MADAPQLDLDILKQRLRPRVGYNPTLSNHEALALIAEVERLRDLGVDTLAQARQQKARAEAAERHEIEAASAIIDAKHRAGLAHHEAVTARDQRDNAVEQAEVAERTVATLRDAIDRLHVPVDEEVERWPDDDLEPTVTEECTVTIQVCQECGAIPTYEGDVQFRGWPCPTWRAAHPAAGSGAEHDRGGGADHA